MSKKPVVKPKVSKTDSKGRNSCRSRSKDEPAGAGKLDVDKDEELARQLQVHTENIIMSV